MTVERSTYRNLEISARRIAAVLLSLLKPGDRALLMFPLRRIRSKLGRIANPAQYLFRAFCATRRTSGDRASGWGADRRYRRGGCGFGPHAPLMMGELELVERRLRWKAAVFEGAFDGAAVTGLQIQICETV